MTSRNELIAKLILDELISQNVWTYQLPDNPFELDIEGRVNIAAIAERITEHEETR